MKKIILAGCLYLASVLGAMAGVSCSVPFNLTNGTTADASQVMANYNAILACLLNGTAENGVNSSITALTGLTTPLSPAQGGTPVFVGGTSTGSANAQAVATTTPANFSLTTSYTVIFVAGYTNTATTTLEANGQTVAATTSPSCSSGTCPPSLYRQSPSGPQPMTGGEVQAGQLIVAQWDGTYFECVTCNVQFGGLGPLTNLASASTTDLGTIPSHNINVTSTTTITSFGASASTTYPKYHVVFAGSLTITYNQTNCSTTGNCILTPAGVNLVTQTNDTAELTYLGAGSGGGGNWSITGYQRASGGATTPILPTPGGFSGLSIKTASNTTATYAATWATLYDSTSGLAPTCAFSGTINFGTNGGVNALDGLNSIASATWYYIWLISNDSCTNVAAMASPASEGNSPTMPSGYTAKYRFGQMRTAAGSAQLLGSYQYAKHVQFTPAGQGFPAAMLAGTSAGSSWTAIATTNFIPSTGTVGYFSASNGVSLSYLYLAPNTGYSAETTGSGTVPNAPIGASEPVTGNAVTASGSFLLESSNIYYYSNGTSLYVYCLGWDDNI